MASHKQFLIRRYSLSELLLELSSNKHEEVYELLQIVPHFQSSREEFTTDSRNS
jgi:hypothetical protein